MATTAKKSTTRTRKPKAEEVVQYLIQGDKGDFVIELPESWRLTFGAVNPGGPTPGRDMHCVRVWNGQKLRAVYANCKGFRDLGIPLARKVEKEMGSAKWEHDSAGNFNSSREVRREDGGFQLEAPVTLA